MLRTINIQFFGSAVVVAAFAAAEGAVRLLDVFPASPFVWYLNLRFFGVFEAARMDGSALQPLFQPDALEVALTLLVILVLARIRRLRFGLALAANLSFVATLFLAEGVLRGMWIETRSASLLPITILPAGESVTLVTMVLASSMAFFASHVSFVHAVMREHFAAPPDADRDDVDGSFHPDVALTP